MPINLSTVLDQDGGKQLVREYLDKTVLARRDWTTPLVNISYAQSRPLPAREGQWTEYTRKGRIRRPEHMASPDGAGSDPASGATLGTNKILVPIEFMHEYVEIATVSKMTSWLDLESWAKDDLPVALKRRMNELVQNAFLVGRMTPFAYTAGGLVTAGVDQTAEATATLYGQSFTFQSAPKYYAGSTTSFADMVAGGKTLKWSDVRRINTKLKMAGATPVQGDKLMWVISDAQANDLLADDDGGRLNAVINSGAFKPAISGLENHTIFSYAGAIFVVDPSPFTEEAGAEGKRANYGGVHSALVFGKEAFGYMPMGSGAGFGSTPKFKVQDITKVGYGYTIGYLVPWQVAIINPDWCAVVKSVAGESKPNNFSPADPDKQLENFGNML